MHVLSSIFTPHSVKFVQENDPLVKEKVGRYKSLVSTQQAGGRTVKALFVRDFFGRSRHSGNLFSIIGLGRSMGDMFIREAVRLAREELWAQGSPRNEKPPIHHAPSLDLIGGIEVASDPFGAAAEAEDAVWRDWLQRYSLETLRHGIYTKYRVTNMLISGQITYVNFFIPEMLAFLKHINIHLLNTKYSDKQLTIKGHCTYIQTEDFESQFEWLQFCKKAVCPNI